MINLLKQDKNVYFFLDRCLFDNNQNNDFDDHPDEDREKIFLFNKIDQRTDVNIYEDDYLKNFD